MKEEHEAFLRGLVLYQKEWDLIATVVKTRTVLQVRTHGQKYFAKLEKGEVFPEEVSKTYNPRLRQSVLVQQDTFVYISYTR